MRAEAAKDYAVQITVSIGTNPTSLTLTWLPDLSETPSSYTVYRKTPEATDWGTGTVLSGTTLSYTDRTVVVGKAYEYQVSKANSRYSGYGYVRTGIAVPEVESRGSLVLLVDSTLASGLASELTRLTQDLVGDGWKVLRHDVSRTANVKDVKALIKADYTADPNNVNAVFLFGHIPVARSGIVYADPHLNHKGAWPADVYYGDMTGSWTDTTANFVQNLNGDPSMDGPLTNVPGDGKFDQTSPPGSIRLQVGRVDFSNLPGRATMNGTPTFASELELSRQYLNKDHAFRQTLLQVPRRAIMGDYFGVVSGWANAASGWRSFAPLVGTDKITDINLIDPNGTGKWVKTLHTDAYLLAYGCGYGQYTYANGIGSTTNDFGTSVEVVNNDIKAVFVELSGSLFGEWDHEDDLLRATLAAKTYTLTCAWSGLPHWYIHHLGMGETIGYSTRAVQNNTTLYKNYINIAAHYVHIALMGDPTLRLHPVMPPSAGYTRVSASQVQVNWTASPDTVAGYHVYRASAPEGPYARLNTTPVTGTSFVDTGSATGTRYYMVRARKLESSPSGTYYNLSQGHFVSVTPPVFTVAPESQTVAPGSQVVLEGTAVSATSYQWQRNGVNVPGATSPTLTLNAVSTSNAGTYTLVARNFQGSTTSLAATLLVATPVEGKLINLSARAIAGQNEKTLIAGFVLSSEASKSVLARGVGPALKGFGVAGFLPDPVLKLYRSGVLLKTVDNWEDNGAGSAVASQSALAGAFALPAKSLDAAVIASLSAGTNYTAEVSGKVSTEGVALAELYDRSEASDATAPIFVNLSARSNVGTDSNTLIAGFIISGNVPRRMLIRGVGPTLAAFNVAGALADPVIDVHTTINSVDTVIASNDNWSSVPESGALLSALFSQTGAFALPTGSADAALVLTLVPGNYTVQLSGINKTTGIALMEIFDLSAIL